MVPGVTESFSSNFLNSSLLLNVHVFSADTKHESADYFGTSG